MNVPSEHLFVLAAILFSLGVLGFLLRRNVIVVLASVELILNAANLTFVAGARSHALSGEVAGVTGATGPLFAVFVILVAAVEAAIGLALVIALFRLKQSVQLDAVTELKG